MKQRYGLVAQLTALLGAALLLSGCAVAVRGTTQLVPVDSVPAGAEVIVDGEVVGRTPFELSLGRSSEHLITLRWNGQERSFTLHPQVDGEGGGLLVADAVPGGVLIGISAVQLASCGRPGGGSWFDFSGLCRDLGLLGLGIGAGLVAIPVGIDTISGGIYQLSPHEIFVTFE